MDALRIDSKWPVFLLLMTSCLAFASPPARCKAGDGSVYSYPDGQHQFFDGSTRCRWRRTWHGPNAIWTRLSPYYIPRPTDPCLGGGCGHCSQDGMYSGCTGDCYPIEQRLECAGASGAVGYGGGEMAGVQAGFERLGQIPNDLGIAGAAPVGPAAPSR